MKVIKITSKVYGIKEIFVDDEDYESLIRTTWWLTKVNKKGDLYVAGLIDVNTRVYLHRHLMNASSGFLVDHKDRNPLNNQRSNLRICSKAENQRNRKKIENTSSKYIGVHKHLCGKWQAAVSYNREHFYLGLFETELEAAIARDIKTKELHGDFATLNF